MLTRDLLIAVVKELEKNNIRLAFCANKELGLDGPFVGINAEQVEEIINYDIAYRMEHGEPNALREVTQCQK